MGSNPLAESKHGWSEKTQVGVALGSRRMGPNRSSVLFFPVGGPGCLSKSYSLSVLGAISKWRPCGGDGTGGSWRPWRPQARKGKAQGALMLSSQTFQLSERSNFPVPPLGVPPPTAPETKSWRLSQPGRALGDLASAGLPSLPASPASSSLSIPSYVTLRIINCQ